MERHTVFTIVTDLAEMASEHPHVDAMQVFLHTILLITLPDLRQMPQGEVTYVTARFLQVKRRERICRGQAQCMATRYDH